MLGHLGPYEIAIFAAVWRLVSDRSQQRGLGTHDKPEASVLALKGARISNYLFIRQFRKLPTKLFVFSNLTEMKI